ncbi:LysR substrate-binding domain-containing protein [Sneathiella aquimaris]|uniref:LysR substrate-binding domain-containing protein n=1 Tax=Sneathiella aquimaris TaxID=2599305 RepID=UPI00146C65E5|nr:LysR substrate-binding domain-containing protein [Sneathiella aquimaris]
MKSIPLNNLHAYSVVFEAGGVRAAARVLGVTHSSVSRHIRELEAWMGVPLLEKAEGRRKLIFTPEGEKLAKEASAHFSGLQASVQSIRERADQRTVVIETTPSFAIRWLLPRLGEFEEKQPDIEVSVLIDQRQKTPSEAGADFSVRMGRGPWREVDCMALMDEEFVPVVSPDLWRKWGTPTSLDEIQNIRLLHDRDPNISWPLWSEQHGVSLRDPNKGPRYTSSDLVLRAAEQGLGLALAPKRMAAESIKAGHLIAPLSSASVEIGDYYWIVQPRIRLGRWAVERVIQWMQGRAVD